MHRKLNIGIEVWIPTGDRGNQKDIFTTETRKIGSTEYENEYFSFPRSCVGMHRKLNIGIEVWFPRGTVGTRNVFQGFYK